MALSKKQKLVRELERAGIPVLHGRLVKLSDLERFAMAQTDVAPYKAIDRIPTDEKRETLKLFYETLLTAMGREAEYAVFERAIEMIPAKEIEQEFKAVTDGTVSKIVKTMMRDDLSEDEIAEMGAIWEGLAKPYFQEYKGEVPEEDLEWAHNQIGNFFDKLEKGRVALPQPRKRLK